MANLIALAAGLLFGSGLALSGLNDPARVRGFLDIRGAWDPTLIFVMMGAVAVMMLAWAMQRRARAPLAAPLFDLPSATKIDAKLAAGALLFGTGWGVGGLCPGPAIADLAIRPADAILFVAAMLAGMTLHRFTTR
jgi:uncharacterized membrane protein YedE/YeeE